MLSLYVDSLGANEARPHNAQDVMAITGADAALDGPMFSLCDSSQSYASADCGVVGYKHLDLATGVNIPSSFPSRGMTISIKNGVASPTDVSGAQVAVQLYPTLVTDGRPAMFGSGAVASRAGLAIMRDGRLAFVTSVPMTLDDFSSKLAAAGAVSAGYTDGGGSTSLAVKPNGYSGSSEHRRVVTWLLAKARTPSVVVPIGLILAGALAWYGWSKRKHA